MTQPPPEMERFIFTSTANHTYSVAWTHLGARSRPPLVFVHGTPWSSALWMPFARALEHEFSIYLFDNPGFGESFCVEPETTGRGADPDVSMALQAETFARLLEFWQLPSPPHVVAHDIGGVVTLRALIVHGARFSSLLLLDAVALLPFGSPFYRLVGQQPETFKQIPENIFKGLLRAYIQGAAYKKLREEDLQRLCRPWLRKEGGRQGQDGFVRQIQQASTVPIEEILPHYTKVGQQLPVKVVWGKEDTWIPWTNAQMLADQLGAKELSLIPDAGHLVHLDQPERLAVEITVWLLQNQDQ